jgi:S-DNA-T family DNA segregation ATPase FtsK/SpoIIIE
MAVDHPIDTDDGAIPRAVRRFVRNRLFELFGFGVFAASAAAGVALATWSPADPSLNRAIDGPIVNLLGYGGAVVADELMQFLGLASIAALAVPLAWSARLMSHDPVPRPIKSVLAWIATVLAAAGFVALLPSPSSWPLEAGLGGQAGDVLRDGLLTVLGLGLKNVFATFVAAVALAGSAILSATVATGIGRSETSLLTRLFGETVSDAMLSVAGAIQHAYLGWRARAALKRALLPAPAPQPISDPKSESRFLRLIGIVGAALLARRGN